MVIAATGSGITASMINCPPPRPTASPQPLSGTHTSESSVVTPTTTTTWLPQTPSNFTPPTAPSSYTGSLASSIKPSSSISVRVGESSTGKRKADDDDISMVSATSRSAVRSTLSSGTRKRRTTTKDVNMSRVNNNLESLNATFRENVLMMGNVFNNLPHLAGAQPSVASTSVGPAVQAQSIEDLKDEATNHLLLLEMGVFNADQMGMILEAFQTDASSVKMYLRLVKVTNPSAEVTAIRRSWLMSLLKLK
ncbi:hypothetical protein J3R83DRAFT_5429 [Lanmaoa asiatica]|nr:hypothetical protein J3R83DRAFT_5429 [Lanmaoa asiatica]